MIELTSPELAEYRLDQPALFYGAHANYTRMGGLVCSIVEHGLPIGLVNTGQHWDPEFIGSGFGPDVEAVDLQTHTSDIEVIRAASREYLKQGNHDGVFVYGDTASALGPALAAKDLDMPVIHLEAGFRTYDSNGNRSGSSLPEEGIRNQIDQLADLTVPLLPSCADALAEEQARGLLPGAITAPTGHPLADPIINNRPAYNAVQPNDGLGLLTIHRKANLIGGKDSGLARVLGQVGSIGTVEWIFVTYPSTARLIDAAGLKLPRNVHPIPPTTHNTMLDLVSESGIIVSDSAGLQVEAGLAPRRLVIPRDETEYPDLLGETVVMCDPDSVGNAVNQTCNAQPPTAERLAQLDIAFGDGQANQKLFRLVARLTSNRVMA